MVFREHDGKLLANLIQMQRQNDAVLSQQSADLVAQLRATKRISGRLIASQIAAASRASFFCPFKYGFTNGGATSRTSWPNVPITRDQ